jgi:hypothetical protein
MGLHTPPCGAPLSVWCQRHSSRVSRLEHVSDESQKSVIVDALIQNAHEYFMGQASKTIRDITLDKPVDSLPGLHNFAECGVASP